MPISYTILPNPLTTPPSFSPKVVTKNTRRTAALAARIAERTSQSPEAVVAVFTALGDEILPALLEGDAVILDNILQATPTLNGKVQSATGDLPADSTAGISLRAIGRLLSQLK